LSGEYDVDPAMVYGIMREESGFDPRVVSWAGAVGLMQLMEPTARSMAKKLGVRPAPTRATLKRPPLNMRLGCAFLGRLMRKFGHPAVAVAAYNAGAGRLRQWLRKWKGLPLDEFVEKMPFDQTRGYTKRVLESWVRYRVLYMGLDAVPALPSKLPTVD